MLNWPSIKFDVFEFSKKFGMQKSNLVSLRSWFFFLIHFSTQQNRLPHITVTPILWAWYFIFFHLYILLPKFFFAVVASIFSGADGATIWTFSSPNSSVAFLLKLLPRMSIINGSGRWIWDPRGGWKNWEPQHQLHVLVKKFDRIGKHELEHLDTFTSPHTLY